MHSYRAQRRARLPVAFLIAFGVALGAAACATATSSAPPKSVETDATDESNAEPPVEEVAASTTTTTTVPAPPQVYAHTGVGHWSDAVAGVPERVYVPNSKSNTVSVIDPATLEVIDRFNVGRLPHHVTPSWDLTTLYVNNTQGNTLIPIDPFTGKPGQPIPVEDPYNLYFTPDGTQAIVVAERLRRLDFRDPNTWALIESVQTPCVGVNHIEFSLDERYLVATCEFSGDLIRVDLSTREVVGTTNTGGKPVAVKLSPDGTVLFVADETRDGVAILDPETLAELQFIPTGDGTHGLYPSRDASVIYVTNRLAGTVTVIDFTSRQIVATWNVGGYPDMGSVSPDGTRLWLSSRYNTYVMVIDTATGQVIKRIETGGEPHGLTYFPQPGRYSLGHTGDYR